MANPANPSPFTNLGFLAILQEQSGTLGGYLVTNSWGRPLEFRLSSAVQPNRVQHILYGDSLPGFLCGELIGKTLVEKTTTPVQCVLTDHPHALEVRLRLNIPVALVWGGALPMGIPALSAGSNLFVHASEPDDAQHFRRLLESLGNFDLTEPFLRIREAIAEARRMGVAQKSIPPSAAA
jgi:hypothetical protein